jgi:hypothetical protein
MPWLTLGNEICDNDLLSTGGYKVAFTAGTRGVGTGLVTSKDMLAALKGNRFVGSVQLEGSDGTAAKLDATGLAAALGSAYSDTAPPVPADIAAVLK